jgi:drug/metabolite transporter (DMT)-like permease
LVSNEGVMNITAKENSMKVNNEYRTASSIETYFFLVIGLPVLFWACAFPLIIIGLRELSPINLAILRLFIASIIFLFLVLFQKKRFSPFYKKDTLTLFLLGFIGISTYHLGLNYGEQFVSAGAASLIIATIPIFVVVLAKIILSEVIDKQILFGIIISLTGVVVISLWGNPSARIEINYISGALAVVLAAFVGAVYTTFGKKLLTRYNPLSLTAYAFLIGNLGLIPFISRSFFEEITSLSLVTWSSVLFLAIFPTVIAYSLWYTALKVKKASELSVYLYVTPVIATLLGAVFLDEQITIFYILGGAFVLFGLYIVNKQRRRKLKLIREA